MTGREPPGDDDNEACGTSNEITETGTGSAKMLTKFNLPFGANSALKSMWKQSTTAFICDSVCDFAFAITSPERNDKVLTTPIARILCVRAHLASSLVMLPC